MRILLAMLCWVVASAAFGQAPTQDEIIHRAREAFLTAKSKEAVESIKVWCTDSIRSINARENERLMQEAIKLMEADKIEEANISIRKVNAQKELADNLAQMVCRPDSP